MLEKQAVECLPCSPNLRFYINELHETISFFQWVNDSNASECQSPVNDTQADEWCHYNQKWKVKMTTTSQDNSEMEKTSEMEKLENISGELSLERRSAGVTLLLWSQWHQWHCLTGAVRPVRALGKPPLTHSSEWQAPQSLLKKQWGQLRVRMDEKTLFFGAGRVEWLTDMHMTHTPVLTEEGGTEQRFAKLSEGSQHCWVPRKNNCIWDKFSK